MEKSAKAFTKWATSEMFDSIFSSQFSNPYPCEYFIEHAKLNPNCTDPVGRTPLEVAVLRGKENAVNSLLKYDCIPVTLELCELAAYGGHIKIMRTLIDSRKLTVRLRPNDVLDLNRYAVFRWNLGPMYAINAEDDFGRLTEKLGPIVERLNVGPVRESEDPRMYMLATRHIVRNARLPYSMLAKCIESCVKYKVSPDTVLKILGTIGAARWDQDRGTENLTQATIKIIQYISKSHPNKQSELAERVGRIGWKNELLFLFVGIGFSIIHQSILAFLLFKCDCDPNARNEDGNSVVHEICDRVFSRTNRLRSQPVFGQIAFDYFDLVAADRGRVYPAIETFLQADLHPCLTDSKGRKIGQILEKEFPDLHRKYCTHPLSLQCIAASEIMKSKIQVPQRIRTSIRNFILFH